MKIYHIFLVYSSDGHLSFLYSLTIVSRAAMNMDKQVSLWWYKVLGYMSKSGVAGLYGRSIFSFLRDLRIDFHIRYTSFSLPQVVDKCFFSQYLPKNLS